MRDTGRYVEYIDFDCLGRGVLRMVRLTRFMELDKAEMDRIGIVWRIVVLGPKEYPMQTAGKGRNISNIVEGIKLVFFQEEEETLREYKGLSGDERFIGEVNKRVDLGVRTGVSVV